MVFAFIAALMGYGPDWARRWWMWVAASLVALGVIDSFSRGAWVASVGAIGFMGVVAWAIRGRRMINRRFVIPGIFIPVLSFIAVDLLGHLNLSHSAISVISRQTTGERLQSTVGAVFHPTGHFATAKRLLIWKDALRATRLHPILGVGLGGFHRFAQLHPMRGLVAAPPMAHNLYLEWGADLGILGIVVALWLEWSWVRKSIGVLKSSSGSLTSFEWAMGLGAFGAIVSFVVHDWVDLMIDHGVIVPLLLGLAVVWRLADARGRASRSAESHPDDGG
jgi:O-antigen ligase